MEEDIESSDSAKPDASLGAEEEEADPDAPLDAEEEEDDPGASLEAEEVVAEPDTSLKEEEEVAKADASLEAEEEVAKPDASLEAEEEVAKPDASLEEEEEDAELDASPEAEEEVAKLDDSLEAEEEEAGPDASLEENAEPDASPEAEEEAAEPDASPEAKEEEAGPDVSLLAEEEEAEREEEVVRLNQESDAIAANSDEFPSPAASTSTKTKRKNKWTKLSVSDYNKYVPFLCKRENGPRTKRLTINESLPCTTDEPLLFPTGPRQCSGGLTGSCNDDSLNSSSIPWGTVRVSEDVEMRSNGINKVPAKKPIGYERNEKTKLPSKNRDSGWSIWDGWGTGKVERDSQFSWPNLIPESRTQPGGNSLVTVENFIGANSSGYVDAVKLKNKEEARRKKGIGVGNGGQKHDPSDPSLRKSMPESMENAEEKEEAKEEAKKEETEEKN